MSYQGFHLKDQFPSQVTLPAPAQIFDATQCVQTGINPNTSGPLARREPMDRVPEHRSRPRKRSDLRYGGRRNGKFDRAKLLSFIPTSPTGTQDIVANNTLDLNNFHVKFDYIFNQSHRVSVKYLFGDSLKASPPAWRATVSRSPGHEPEHVEFGCTHSRSARRSQLHMDHQPYQGSGKPARLSTVFSTDRSEQQYRPQCVRSQHGSARRGRSDKENFGVPSVYYLGYFGPNGYPVVGGIQGYPIITRPDASYDWQEHFTMIKGTTPSKSVGNIRTHLHQVTARPRAFQSVVLFLRFLLLLHRPYLPLDIQRCYSKQPRRRAERNAAGARGGQRPIVRRHRAPHFPEVVGLYVQDSWKVKPNFTLEVGSTVRRQRSSG